MNVVVAGFIFKGDKLLIDKRSATKQFLPGYFELPGGHVEDGESPQEALIREVKEEIGVDVEVLSPYHSFAFTYYKGNAVEIAFFARIIGDQTPRMVAQTEIDEIRWVSEAELDSFNISEKEKETMKIGFKKLKTAML